MNESKFGIEDEQREFGDYGKAARENQRTN